ncbi:MAG: hypothetical protein KGO51_05485 [Alphaproteobacteria bacterium]|nr:hypothetical protein [Alphaproteobacteria bacterium]
MGQAFPDPFCPEIKLVRRCGFALNLGFNPLDVHAVDAAATDVDGSPFAALTISTQPEDDPGAPAGDRARRGGCSPPHHHRPAGERPRPVVQAATLAVATVARDLIELTLPDKLASGGGCPMSDPEAAPLIGDEEGEHGRRHCDGRMAARAAIRSRARASIPWRGVEPGEHPVETES